MRIYKLIFVDIEKALGVTPVETISIHPDRPLYEALRRMLQSRARRIPLVDVDDETQRPMIVSVITQYRILKFISTNVQATQLLKTPLKDLINVGTYSNLSTASMNTPVMDVIHLLVKHNISSVPIVNKDSMSLTTIYFFPKLTSIDVLINIFESVDVIALIQGGGSDYDNFQLTVGEALLKRSDVRILFRLLCLRLTLSTGFLRHTHLLLVRPTKRHL
jgi:5'-AMP-activated protein kinase, regulatory gamma subunit